MEDTIAIAKTDDPRSVQQMCVNTRHLGRHVGTYTEGPAGSLVDQFEST